MRGDLILPLATLWGFLLTLARVSGAFVFVPIPGMRGGLEMGRAVLAVTVTVALFPQWPRLAEADVSTGQMAAWLFSEAGLGIAVGLGVTLLLESFTLAAQLIGLQAGYAYASTIDPSTQADSSILLVLAQLVAGLLFFALGFDREVLRIFASSLAAHPPGSFVLHGSAAGHAGARADGARRHRAGSARADQYPSSVAHGGIPGKNAGHVGSSGVDDGPISRGIPRLWGSGVRDSQEGAAGAMINRMPAVPGKGGEDV